MIALLTLCAICQTSLRSWGMPGEDARVGVLRGLVPSFRELRGQRLTNALLRSELQRHVGGVVHLPPEFRRKRADQQHFITGQPKREVLLAAWHAFTDLREKHAAAREAAAAAKKAEANAVEAAKANVPWTDAA